MFEQSLCNDSNASRLARADFNLNCQQRKFCQRVVISTSELNHIRPAALVTNVATETDRIKENSATEGTRPGQ